MQCTDIPGRLLEQLNAALAVAFPTETALRMLLRYECDKNLNAIASTNAGLDVTVFEVVEHAITYNWLDILVAGACRRNPEKEQLRLAAEALGSFGMMIPQPSVSSVSASLLVPHRFDLTTQVHLIAENMQSGQIVGFLTSDTNPDYLRNLLQRLNNDFGRQYTYCHHTMLQVNPLQHPAANVLATILGKARARLLDKDVIFIVTGLRTDFQLASFWAQLKAVQNTMEIRRTLAIIFACDEDVSPPPDLHRLEPPHFTRADIRLWITPLVMELHWPVTIVDFWEQTILECTFRDGKFINPWIYDHLDFACRVLSGVRDSHIWLSELQQWRQDYV